MAAAVDAADREQFVQTYRKVLNCDSGQGLEALVLADRLFDRGIISEAERSLLKHEDNFFIRQYILLLKILPTKGAQGSRALIEILKQFNCDDAVTLLSSELDGDYDFEETDIYIPAAIEPVAIIKRAALREVIPDDQLHLIIHADQVPGAPPSVAYAPPGRLRIGLELKNKEKPFETRLNASEFQIDPSNLEMGPKIGDGGFSSVYGAYYKNQRVAVKQFLTYDEFSLNMFYEEVTVMRQLHHPNIVSFVGYAHNENCLWLITEYVMGGAMRRFCEPEKSGSTKLSKDQKIKVAQKCFCGLDYLHTRKLCHKDISPGNVLISDDLSDIKISDFGLAEFKHLATATLTTLKGTAMYYPPEFASSQGIVRHPVLSDVYSMGASLCELFSELPFWNTGGKRLSDVQVMFVLAEVQHAFNRGLPFKEPDCKNAVDASIWTAMQWSVAVDLNQRKSASEMYDLLLAL